MHWKKNLPSNFGHQVEEFQGIHILCSNPYLHWDYNNHHHHIHIHNCCFHHHNNHPLCNYQLHTTPRMIYNVHRSFGNFPSSTHGHNIYQHNLCNQFSGDQYLDNLHFQYLQIDHNIIKHSLAIYLVFCDKFVSFTKY